MPSADGILREELARVCQDFPWRDFGIHVEGAGIYWSHDLAAELLHTIKHHESEFGCASYDVCR